MTVLIDFVCLRKSLHNGYTAITALARWRTAYEQRLAGQIKLLLILKTVSFLWIVNLLINVFTET